MLPEFLIKRYNTEDSNEIRRIKMEAESFHKSIADVVEVKAYEAKEIMDLCKTAGVTYMEGYEERVATFIISSEDTDRDSDVIKQNGIDKSDYMKNPVIMFAHNRMSLPVGATLKIWRSNNQTKALALFYDDRADKTGLSDTIFRMVKAGALRGASIGFSAKDAHYPTDSEIKEYKMEPWGVVYEKVALMEWSVCSIPANQNALRTSKAFEDKHFKIAEEYNLIEKNSDKTEGNNKVLLEKIDKLEQSVESLKSLVSETFKSLPELIQKSLTSSKEKEKEYDEVVKTIEGLVNSFK